MNLIDIIDDRLKYKNITVDFTALKDVLESLPELNNNIKKNVSEIFANITNKLNQFILYVFDKYNSKINDLKQPLKEFLNIFLNKGIDKLSEVFDFIKELKNKLKGNGMLDQLLSLIDIIEERQEEKNIKVDFTILKDVLKSLPELNNNIKKNVSEIFANITKKLNQFKLSELLNKYNSKIYDLTESLQKNLKLFFKKGKDKLSEVFDSIKELHNLTGNGMKDKLLNLIDNIEKKQEKNKITIDFTALKYVLEILDEFNTNINKNLPKLLANIGTISNQFNLYELLNKHNRYIN